MYLSAWCLSPLPEVLASLSLCSVIFNWTGSGERGQQRSFLIVYLSQLWKGELLEQGGVCSRLVQGWGWCQGNSKGWRTTRCRCSCAPVKPSQNKAGSVLNKGKGSELFWWQSKWDAAPECYKHSGLNVCACSTGVPSQTEHWKLHSVIFSNPKDDLKEGEVWVMLERKQWIPPRLISRGFSSSSMECRMH